MFSAPQSRIAFRASLVLAVLLFACQGPRTDLAAIDVTPSQLGFMTETLSPVEKTIDVRAIGTAPLIISSLTMAQANDLTLPAGEQLTTDCAGNPRTTSNPLKLLAGECARVTVRYSPEYPVTIMNQVIIVSNAINEPTVTVPVTAVYDGPPPVCPIKPVAQIQAVAGSSPLPSGGTTPPALVVFSGTASSPSPGATIIGYSWQLLTTPQGVMATLATGNSTTALNSQQPGSYQVGLTVTDSHGCVSDPVTFSYSMMIPPCWNVFPPTAQVHAFLGNQPLNPPRVLQDTTIILDGTDSMAGTRPTASYHWSIVSAPPGSTAVIVPNGPKATIDLTSAGVYVLGLVVTDSGMCSSAPATVTINVAPLPPICGSATQYIYVIDEQGVLYAFSPPTQTFKTLGTIECPAPGSGATVNTMAVDRYGMAWVEYSDGSLFQVDTTSLECWPTSFNVNETSSHGWGSSYAANTPGSQDETYYIAYSSSLASIDTTTLAVKPIGPLLQSDGLSLATEPELTGTSDARLYGFFPGQPWTLAEIDKGSGTILSEQQLPAVDVDVSMGGNWAFSSWGNDFWFFVGAGSPTGVFHYDANTGVTNFATSISTALVGAGVSPCVQGT